MPRVTATEVRKIIKVKASADLTEHIDAASELVTDVCSDSDYADAKLKRIELWLAAHFVAIQYSRPTQEYATSVGAQYQSKVDLGLDVTHYGQQAKRIDTAGNLAALDNALKDVEVPLPAGKKKVSLSWLGKERPRSGF